MQHPFFTKPTVKKAAVTQYQGEITVGDGPEVAEITDEDRERVCAKWLEQFPSQVGGISATYHPYLRYCHARLTMRAL
eukprot:2401693-Rhodomonas_salina.2